MFLHCQLLALLKKTLQTLTQGCLHDSAQGSAQGSCHQLKAPRQHATTSGSCEADSDPGVLVTGVQAGGVSACVTALTAQPVHRELRSAAASLLCAAAHTQPAATSTAFLSCWLRGVLGTTNDPTTAGASPVGGMDLRTGQGPLSADCFRLQSILTAQVAYLCDHARFSACMRNEGK